MEEELRQPHLHLLYIHCIIAHMSEISNFLPLSL
jgi:hypothetical protein